MAPTVCIAEGGEDRREPFRLETHLLALKIASSDTNSSHVLHRRRRLSRVLQFTSNTTVMGLVLDDSHQMITREGDSPGLPCGNNGSPSSSKTWSTESEDMYRRKENLIRIMNNTVKLLIRNQRLQKRLAALQEETREFVKSVLNNVENQKETTIKQEIKIENISDVEEMDE